MSAADNYRQLISKLPSYVTLVAVSKTKPVELLREVYDAGQRDFGENYVQELVDKHAQLPSDIRWHFIGHLQTNKVKYIAPFVYLIHGVDSYKLLKEINKQAAKNNRVINVLLQMHIAREETKFGLDDKELMAIVESPELHELRNICIRGLMGMASFTENEQEVRKEFQYISGLFTTIKNKPSVFNFQPSILSIGMSSDYKIAIEEGSTMIRIGTTIFGKR